MGRGGNSSGCARGSFWLPEGEDVGFAMMWPRVGSEGASAQKVLSACSPLSLSRSSFYHSLLAPNSIFSDSSFCVVSAAEPNFFGGVAKSVATWTLLAPRLSSQRDPFVCVCSAVSVSESKLADRKSPRGRFFAYVQRRLHTVSPQGRNLQRETCFVCVSVFRVRFLLSFSLIHRCTVVEALRPFLTFSPVSTM